jgi:hypothetical protein
MKFKNVQKLIYIHWNINSGHIKDKDWQGERNRGQSDIIEIFCILLRQQLHEYVWMNIMNCQSL